MRGAVSRDAAETKPPVLVLRAEPDASRTAKALEDRGHGVVLAPLFVTEPTGLPCPAGTFDAILVTSAKAAGQLAPGEPGMPRDIPVLAVGPHSAEALRHRGFTHVLVSEAARSGLPGLVRQTLPDGARLLAVLGEDRHEDWLEQLDAAGYAVRIWTAYRSTAAGTLPDKARLALDRPDGLAILHFSPRSAAVFVSLAEKAGLAEAARKASHVAISQEAAVPLVEAGARDITIAAAPDLAAVMAALENRWPQQPRHPRRHAQG